MLEMMMTGGRKAETEVIASVPEYLYVIIPGLESIVMMPEYLYAIEADTATIALVPEYLFTAGGAE